MDSGLFTGSLYIFMESGLFCGLHDLINEFLILCVILNIHAHLNPIITLHTVEINVQNVILNYNHTTILRSILFVFYCDHRFTVTVSNSLGSFSVHSINKQIIKIKHEH